MSGLIYTARVEDIEYLKFKGIVRYSHCGGLEELIDRLFEKVDVNAIVIDLEDAEILDSTALGLLARIAIEYKKISKGQPVIFLKRGELDKIIRRVCFDQVFDLVYDNLEDCPSEFTELIDKSHNEEDILRRVVQSHRNLARLSAENENLFQDITRALN